MLNVLLSCLNWSKYLCGTLLWYYVQILASLFHYEIRLNLDITNFVKSAICFIICKFRYIEIWPFMKLGTVTDVFFLHGRGRNIFWTIGQSEKANLNDKKIDFVECESATNNTVSWCVGDVFTLVVRSEASHTSLSTLPPPPLVVSPTVGQSYHEKCQQRGANALSASRFNMSPKREVMQPPALKAREDGAHDATPSWHTHSFHMGQITSKSGRACCVCTQPRWQPCAATLEKDS